MNWPCIPIIQVGGIGDQILGLPFIEQFRDVGIPVKLYTLFPDIAKIFVPWAEIATREQLRIDKPPYYIELIDIVRIFFSDGKPNPKLLPECIAEIYDNLQKNWPVWGKIIDRHPGSCNEMGKLAVQNGLNRWNLASYLVGKPYKPFHFELDEPHIDMPPKFITIHDGFDSSLKFEVSMKSWDIPYWEDLVAKVKDHYPDIKIIQLGGPKHRRISNVDHNLAGALSFKDSLKFLKHSLLHIDGDSGLVHARHLFNKPSVVIFGPTNPAYFGYPENINIAPNYCGECWWLKSTWMQYCVNGYATAKCMQSVTPDIVFEKLEKILNDL